MDGEASIIRPLRALEAESVQWPIRGSLFFLALFSTSSISAKMWLPVTPDFASGIEPVKTSGYLPEVSDKLKEYASAAYFMLLSDLQYISLYICYTANFN